MQILTDNKKYIITIFIIMMKVSCLAFAPNNDSQNLSQGLIGRLNNRTTVNDK